MEWLEEAAAREALMNAGHDDVFEGSEEQALETTESPFAKWLLAEAPVQLGQEMAAEATNAVPAIMEWWAIVDDEPY